MQIAMSGTSFIMKNGAFCSTCCGPCPSWAFHVQAQGWLNQYWGPPGYPAWAVFGPDDADLVDPVECNTICYTHPGDLSLRATAAIINPRGVAAHLVVGGTGLAVNDELTIDGVAMRDSDQPPTWFPQFDRYHCWCQRTAWTIPAGTKLKESLPAGYATILRVADTRGSGWGISGCIGWLTDAEYAVQFPGG